MPVMIHPTMTKCAVPVGLRGMKRAGDTPREW